MDPADILTGFTGDDGQQYGAYLLEFPERKVRAVLTSQFYWMPYCRFELEVFSAHMRERRGGGGHKLNN